MSTRRATALRITVATIGALALLAWGSHVARDGGPWRLAGGPPIVAAASPEPSAPGGDTRSAGEGPGLVGAPFLAILGVVALGLMTAGVTLVYLRLAGDPGDRDRAGSEPPRTRPH
jgi:hypothetical protein